MYWQFTPLLIWPIVIWKNAFRQKVAHRQQQLKRKQQQQKWELQIDGVIPNDTFFGRRL
jgi:hypothetical protein